MFVKPMLGYYCVVCIMTKPMATIKDGRSSMAVDGKSFPVDIFQKTKHRNKYKYSFFIGICTPVGIKLLVHPFQGKKTK